MRQLTALDAQFLALENDRTHGHVGSVAIYDPSTAPGGRVTLDDVKNLLRERLHLLTPFRWRLVKVPFGLDHPYWKDEDEIDLDYHVRELALPAPGDLRQLAEQTARIFERRLDRSRPLWEMYLIHGVDGDKLGLLTKVHHAALDGLSGAEILVTLLDLEPTGREIPPPDPDRERDSHPGSAELFARGLTATPRHTARFLRKLPGTLPNLDLVPTLRSVPGVNTVASAARAVSNRLPGGEELHGERLLAPRTSLNRRISAHRRVALTTISLSEVKRIKNHFGVTVNDVIVTITAAALREWLLTHDELPTDPLLAMIPISVRLPEEFGTFGNRVSMMTVPIPTNQHDPARRVQEAHEYLSQSKARHELTPRMLIQEANEGIPPALLSRTAKTLLGVAGSGRLNPPLNVVISNVPGSPVPLYCAGAQLEANFPLSVITDGMGLNLTIISYRDRIDFGIVGDREEVPDVWFLADEVQHAYEELLELVPAPRAKRAPKRAKPRGAAAAGSANGARPAGEAEEAAVS
ncbi:MAG: wax ester/triacylglycerol synthase family O-acyltransferase [Solirubrobacteraceae bacterium]|nr:wax ester/triacylglycerol synthase family O-acyltransferase [Solirubrobacteraceae bacterium]